MVIKIDGVKAVIVPIVRTQQEFIDLLNWRGYKNRLGMQGIIVYPPAKSAKGRAA